MDELEKVRARFSDDKFATENGAKIEQIDNCYAKCSMELEAKHKNAIGIVMGGAIFTLADFTFAVASNWNKKPTVTLSSQISYIGKAKGNKLIAEAKCVKEGRTTCYYIVEVNDELGNQVANVTVNGFISS